jgi:hypothetical protein
MKYSAQPNGIKYFMLNVMGACWPRSSVWLKARTARSAGKLPCTASGETGMSTLCMSNYETSVGANRHFRHAFAGNLKSGE